MNKCITIGREFGSGGREIGLRLAKALNIPFYDKELVSMAAETGGFSAEFIENYDEKMGSPLASLPGFSLFSYYQQPITDQIFLAQCKVIQKLSTMGPCVIVGRCADDLLKDKAINIFVYADMPSKIKRKLAMDIGVSEQEMEKHILSVDKIRKKYYQHYTGKQWGDMKNHHLCLDTSHVGVEGSVETILRYLEYFK